MKREKENPRKRKEKEQESWRYHIQIRSNHVTEFFHGILEMRKKKEN